MMNAMPPTTVEGYILLFRIHFEHTVVAADGGSEVVHRVWFTGALVFLFGTGVARQVSEGLPKTMRSLKATPSSATRLPAMTRRARLTRQPSDR